MSKIFYIFFITVCYSLNIEAQCDVTHAKCDYPNLKAFPFNDCEVKLYLDYKCECETQCSEYDFDYQAATVIDHNNFDIEYYTEQSLCKCCSLRLVSAFLVKTSSGIIKNTEVLNCPANSLKTLQGLLDGSINYSGISFDGEFISDCYNNRLTKPIGFAFERSSFGFWIRFIE